MKFMDSLRAFDRCQDAVMITTAPPHRPLDGRIVYVNHALSEQTGFTGSELEGKFAGFIISDPRADATKAYALPALLHLNVRRSDSTELRSPTTVWLIRDPGPRIDYVVF